MCYDNKKSCCERPDRLKGRRANECTTKQIKECHGDVKEHPCSGKSNKGK